MTISEETLEQAKRANKAEKALLDIARLLPDHPTLPLTKQIFEVITEYGKQAGWVWRIE